jgi:hypothetical protein
MSCGGQSASLGKIGRATFIGERSEIGFQTKGYPIEMHSESSRHFDDGPRGVMIHDF